MKAEAFGEGRALSSRRQSRRSALLALGGGTLAALGHGLGRLPGLLEGSAATGIVLWAADRAGHAVYGLDRGMIVRSRMPVAAPHALRVRPGGGVEACSAVDGLRSGRHRWVSIVPGSHDAGGEDPVASGPAMPEIGQLAAGVRAWEVRETRRRRRAWALIERRGESRLERWVRDERGPSPRWERAFAFAPGFDARLMAADDQGVWIAAHRRGAYVRVSHRGEVIARTALPDVGGADAMLALCPRTQGHGTQGHGTQGNGTQGHGAQGHGAQGHGEEPGTVAIAAGGALVRLNGRGRRLPGQGGFGHLVALAAPLSRR